MAEIQTFAPPAAFTGRAHIRSFDQYQKMYERSIRDPEGFWGEIAEGFYWKKRWSKLNQP